MNGDHVLSLTTCFVPQPGQVLLLQSQLQYERHRREVHAERNRRLLAKLKGLRLVEEELHTLRLQLGQNASEMAALRRDADALRRQRNAAETERARVAAQCEARTRETLRQMADVAALKERCEEELADERERARALRRDADRLSGRLFEAEAEMAELRRRAAESRRYQQELKEAQHGLIAAREVASLLRQQIGALPSPASAKFEADELARSYKGAPANGGRGGAPGPVTVTRFVRFRFGVRRFPTL